MNLKISKILIGLGRAHGMQFKKENLRESETVWVTTITPETPPQYHTCVSLLPFRSFALIRTNRKCSTSTSAGARARADSSSAKHLRQHTSSRTSRSIHSIPFYQRVSPRTRLISRHMKQQIIYTFRVCNTHHSARQRWDMRFSY